MSAPTRGVPVELDRKRHFRYSLATMRQLEEKFGGLSFEGIGETIHAIYLGLKHEDDELTEEQVAEMIDGQNLGEVTRAMAKALGSDDVATEPTSAPVELPEGNARPAPEASGSSISGPEQPTPESPTTSSGA